jgi:hypothetical protein
VPCDGVAARCAVSIVLPELGKDLFGESNSAREVCDLRNLGPRRLHALQNDVFSCSFRGGATELKL